VVDKKTAQRGSIHVEAAQDGVDFLFGIVRIVGECFHDEVQDDEKFVSHRRKLFKSTVGVEECFQYFTNILGLFLFYCKGLPFALKLSTGIGFNRFLVQVIESIFFVDNPHFDEKRQMVKHIPYGEVQLFGNI
jgi:hypothetical protein